MSGTLCALHGIAGSLFAHAPHAPGVMRQVGHAPDLAVFATILLSATVIVIATLMFVWREVQAGDLS